LKTGILYELPVQELSETLHAQFGDKATKLFDSLTGILDEWQCPGCGHKDSYVYVIAENKEKALEGVNREELGLCATCMVNLIAQKQWTITGDI
jgi:hypothetical protein